MIKTNFFYYLIYIFSAELQLLWSILLCKISCPLNFRLDHKKRINFCFQMDFLSLIGGVCVVYFLFKLATSLYFAFTVYISPAPVNYSKYGKWSGMCFNNLKLNLKELFYWFRYLHTICVN